MLPRAGLRFYGSGAQLPLPNQPRSSLGAYRKSHDAVRLSRPGLAMTFPHVIARHPAPKQCGSRGQIATLPATPLARSYGSQSQSPESLRAIHIPGPPWKQAPGPGRGPASGSRTTKGILALIVPSSVSHWALSLHELQSISPPTNIGHVTKIHELKD